ncbi:MAG TPA: NADH-quinone oxidoreductase subunit A [Nitrospira sp.]|nr:NADH-quinone oxidoreductase subunit A [Nitrospira sp.]
MHQEGITAAPGLSPWLAPCLIDDRTKDAGMDTDPLWHIGLYGFAVLVVIAAMLGLPALLGERHWKKPERRSDIATGLPYESGIQPTGTARIRLPIQYYLVAMLFVIFDLEAVFLYAWAVAVPETGWFGFTEAAIFAAILLAALGYLWRIGALDWSATYQRPSVHRLRQPAPGEQDHALVA